MKKLGIVTFLAAALPLSGCVFGNDKTDSQNAAGSAEQQLLEKTLEVDTNSGHLKYENDDSEALAIHFFHTDYTGECSGTSRTKDIDLQAAFTNPEGQFYNGGKRSSSLVEERTHERLPSC